MSNPPPAGPGEVVRFERAPAPHQVEAHERVLDGRGSVSLRAV